MTIPMSAVYIISKNGERLMPTVRYGHVRHLLKDGKAVVFSRHPFTIQLTYETSEFVQSMEIGVDSGYEHVGISVKSEKREYLSAQFDLLSNEKSRHDDCRKYRRNRRSHLRYRKCRFLKDTKTKGWIAPSLKHKAEAQEQIIKNICAVTPIKKVTVEVGQFDTALLKAMQIGKDIPHGKDYQHGPRYFADSLRIAVFHRDNYTCQICGKSAIKDKVILHTHHALFWKHRHANTLNELITVCDHCHTSANHQPSGKLWGLEPKAPRLEGATFMNIVRWKIIDNLKSSLPGVDICYTYGAVTSRKRKSLKIEKSHAMDAYCIGDFLPLWQTRTEYYQKRRRNNRCLEKFYDARIIDIRDDSIKSGKELGCNRINRRESRNSEKSFRKYRGTVIKHGRRAIRRQRYSIQAGDVVSFNEYTVPCHGMMSGGRSILLFNKKESPTGKAITTSPKKVKLLYHVSGWKKVAHLYPNS